MTRPSTEQYEAWSGLVEDCTDCAELPAEKYCGAHDLDVISEDELLALLHDYYEDDHDSDSGEVSR